MILQSLKMAMKSILSNKLRSFLTMLGIIIGVMALVVLVSLVNGATGSITDSINSLGSDMLTVSISDDYNRPIKLSEMSDFSDLENIESVAPSSQTSVTASSTYAQKSATVIGTTPALLDIQGLTLSSGRFLMTPDIDSNTNVAVVNEDFATDIMGRTNIVGETVSLGGKTYQIIGVYSDDSSLSSMMGSSYTAYIPYTSYVRLSSSASLNITTFYAKAKGEKSELAENELTQVLLDRFYQDEDAFSISSSSAIAETMSSVTGTLSLLLGGIAGISLLVGGIGIMNIMLVSVTERTREIGIRKAIGAGRGIIMLQFLIEALMVSLVGCGIGILLSWVTLEIVNIVGNVDFSLNAMVIIISVLFSMGIGLLFGLYPANKAAKMKPIDALRF